MLHDQSRIQRSIYVNVHVHTYVYVYTHYMMSVVYKRNVHVTRNWEIIMLHQ